MSSSLNAGPLDAKMHKKRWVLSCDHHYKHMLPGCEQGPRPVWLTCKRQASDDENSVRGALYHPHRPDNVRYLICDVALAFLLHQPPAGLARFPAAAAATAAAGWPHSFLQNAG